MRTMITMLFATALTVGLATVAAGGAIETSVKDTSGKPVADAVITAVAASGARPAPGRAVVDQQDRQFVPHVQAVVVGTEVVFPNKDNIRHHVYSFSPAKTFELPLYTGTPANPVVFDRPGIVTIGCNIHDWMIGYIYVSPTPYFGTTRREGRVRLDLPPGTYTVRAWHPRMQEAEEATGRTVTVGTGPAEAAFQLTLRDDPRPRRAPVPGQRGYR